MTVSVEPSVPGDSQLAARIEELASKNTEGELTPAELAEYAGYVRLNKLVVIAQLQLRRLIENEKR